MPTDLVVRFVEARGEDRIGWRAEVWDLCTSTRGGFGLIVHMGEGTLPQIQRDIDAVVPAADAQVQVVLCGLPDAYQPGRRGGVQELHRRIAADPRWGGVSWETEGIAIVEWLRFRASIFGLEHLYEAPCHA